ncbi:MAG TPA: LysR family transcriptional regulator [Polyangiaceae bacterium]|nr:LysR family transcriptional regulator [Polyangiaceae bacterium]
MDLNHVAVFARVVELESFTAASKQLGLPKSSVSRTVTRLEEELGVRLLQRTTRKLHLTEAGLAYYERARVALASLEEAAAAATNSSIEPRGTVRMSAPADIGILNLGDVVARFVRKYPLVHIEISLSSRFVDLVAEGFDLALRAGQLADSSLVARKIGVDSHGVFASPAYLRRRGRPKTVADLAQHDCVLFRGRHGKSEWRLTGPHGEERVIVRGPLSADEMAFVQQAVSAGVGIALLPATGVRLAAARGSLPLPVRLLPEYSVGGNGLSVVSPSARFQSASVTAFRDFLVAELTALWNSA